MTPLRWFLAGGLVCGTAATVLLLVAIARRGAPGPRWDEPEDGVQPPDPYTEERVAWAMHYALSGQRGLGDRPDLWRSSAREFVAEYPRTAELATGGGR